MHSRLLPLLLAFTIVGLPACGSGSGNGEVKKEGKKKRKPKKKGEGKKEDGPGEAEPARKKVTPDLLVALGSEDRDARSKAVREIRSIGKGAVKPLLGLLEKGNIEARTGALLCLGLIGDESAREPIERFLDGAKSGEDLVYAIEALGFTGSEVSVPLLEKYLGYEAPVRFDSDGGYMVEKGRETEEGLIRNQASESLARLGDSSGVPVLIENLLGNGWVRKDAIFRLRRMTGDKGDKGYDLGDGRPAREKAVKAWKAWWEKNGATFKPEWTDASGAMSLMERG